MRILFKFLGKCLTMCLLLVVVDCIVGFIFDRMYDKVYDINKQSYMMIPRFAAEDVDADILIVGASDASHSYIPSVISDSLGLSCYNLGRDGSFFVYQNCMINMILDRYQPKMIIWEMMEDCFTTPFNSPLEFQSISSLYPFYAKSEYVKSVINKRQKTQKVLMFSSMYRNNSKVLGLLSATTQTWGAGDKGYDPLPNGGYEHPVIIKDINTDFIDSEKIQMLKTTLKRCDDMNVRVVLTSAPKYTDGKLKGSEAFFKIVEISKECKVPFIGINDEAEFSNTELFKDNMHLNDRGAHLYMHLFIPQIKDILYQSN